MASARAMYLLPFQLLVSFALGIISLLVVFSAIYLWRRRSRRKPRAGALSLVLPLLLLLWTFTGRWLVLAAFPHDDNPPRALHSNAAITLPRPSGASLHIESFGRAGAPALILTHGWGTDNAVWYHVKRQLGDRYRVIVWDLPGMGQSGPPTNGDYSLDTLADDLAAVVESSGAPRVVLVGHSYGGLVNLTYCRRFPERLGSQVVGLAQLNTTYTNPVITSKNAKEDSTLQKPVFQPLLHLLSPLSPLVRGINWLSYQNGLAHLYATSLFAGGETRGALEFAARSMYESSPKSTARGLLGTIGWDGTAALPNVRIPVLLLTSDQDTIALPQASEYMKKTLPAAELQFIRPAGHLGLLERPTEYGAALAGFARKCLGETAGGVVAASF